MNSRVLIGEEDHWEDGRIGYRCTWDRDISGRRVVKQREDVKGEPGCVVRKGE